MRVFGLAYWFCRALLRAAKRNCRTTSPVCFSPVGGLFLLGATLGLGGMPGSLYAQSESIRPLLSSTAEIDALASPATGASVPVYALELHAANTPDRWWAQDKLQHVTFSFLWTLSTQYLLVEKADWSNRTALPASAGSGAAIGLSKELFDWRLGPTGRFSTRDLAANAVGIVLAIGVILL